MKTLARIVLIPILFAFLACGGDEEATATSTSSPPAATPPAAPTPSPFAATKLTVPLANVTGDHLRAALTGGGWEMASVSVSGRFTTAMARKNGVTATISYDNAAQDIDVTRMQSRTKAVHREGNALLGVTISGNDDAAMALLTSLIGGPPSTSGAASAAPAATPPAAAPAVAAAPATPAAPPQAAPIAAAPTGSSPWSGTEPLNCGGGQNLTINGQTVNLPGQTAITASGACQLTLINCTITAGTVISAGGMARVTITGGRIVGSDASISAAGRATIVVQGAQVEGRVQRSGQATVQGI